MNIFPRNTQWHFIGHISCKITLAFAFDDYAILFKILTQQMLELEEGYIEIHQNKLNKAAQIKKQQEIQQD